MAVDNFYKIRQTLASYSSTAIFSIQRLNLGPNMMHKFYKNFRVGRSRNWDFVEITMGQIILYAPEIRIMTIKSHLTWYV